MKKAPVQPTSPASPAGPRDSSLRRGRAPSGGGRRATHEGRRTCVGCGKRDELEARGAGLVRVLRADTGEVGVDARGGEGRGANLHPRSACIERAVERSLARSLGGALFSSDDGGALVPLDAAALRALITRTLERRLSGVLAAARRRHDLVLGGESCEREAGSLGALVVACDAGSVAEKRFVSDAVRRGVVVALSTKQGLAALVGEDRAEGIAVLGVSAGSVAGEVMRVARSVAALQLAPRASVSPGVESSAAGAARQLLGERGPEPSQQGSGLDRSGNA